MKLIIIQIMLVVWLVAEYCVRFSHPALTETQLFLQFWPLHVCGIACCIGFGLMQKK